MCARVMLVAAVLLGGIDRVRTDMARPIPEMDFKSRWLEALPLVAVRPKPEPWVKQGLFLREFEYRWLGETPVVKLGVLVKPRWDWMRRSNNIEDRR
jgi:hypothetical protein